MLAVAEDESAVVAAVEDEFVVAVAAAIEEEAVADKDTAVMFVAIVIVEYALNDLFLLCPFLCHSLNLY